MLDKRSKGALPPVCEVATCSVLSFVQVWQASFFIAYLFFCGRSATGEDWHKIMQACYYNAKCDPQVDTDKYGPTCGTTVGAILYFCSFIFLCMFLVSTREENTDGNPGVNCTKVNM